jgi:hypothetical protein
MLLARNRSFSPARAAAYLGIGAVLLRCVSLSATMKEFERGPLRQYTPCRFDSLADQASALVIVHSELVLIHPFRVMLH